MNMQETENRRQKPARVHEPVLMQEVLDALDVQSGEVVLDCTLGGAGHFAKLYEKLGAGGTIVGLDADPRALERASAVVAEDPRTKRPQVYLVESNFRYLGSVLEEHNLAAFDKALFDLGWSSHQLEERRGFSFMKDEPLLMTYGDGGSAAEIVNSASEQELADIIFNYGEERAARRIAKAIVARRARGRILSTKELVEAIESALPRRGKIHPATKTFQALRIAANDELGALREGLAAALAKIAAGGRIAVISFHSLEDRIVKEIFRDARERGAGRELSKKPLAPSAAEIARNPRARSAKLRVFSHA
ncbi:MAG TPA: 16S rRNA (cytosine(1402)-N(4))-methyltransferase RsmH [Candidatus Paceibacterota bacterium]|nr:16S rRNA (cytosine(1402)-N(4))-methyltransferase RsmH [Candidatus Paceibacterota bacterium]